MHDPPSLTVVSRRDQSEASVFRPENLLRETRRLRGLPSGPVPSACLLDPDGDVVRLLQRSGAERSPSWACYHSEMWVARFGQREVGVVGCAVGAPYAVLVAEQCFASGCRLLVSVTSAGQVVPELAVPCFVLIDRALRGDGVSHCYLAPGETVEADPDIVALAEARLAGAGSSVVRGTSWTTDAPYRETETSLAYARDRGALIVEMESAALYAYGRATGNPVICLAHVTNQLGQVAGDFEKGPDDGVSQVLEVVAEVIEAIPPGA